MPRPGGNPNRCEMHGSLAGKDGYCKRCRPARNRTNMFRDNFMNAKQDFTSFEEKEEFGIVKDKFGMEERWGDR